MKRFTKQRGAGRDGEGDIPGSPRRHTPRHQSQQSTPLQPPPPQGVKRTVSLRYISAGPETSLTHTQPRRRFVRDPSCSGSTGARKRLHRRYRGKGGIGVTVWDVGPRRLDVRVPRDPLARRRGQSAWASHCRLAAGVQSPARAPVSGLFFLSLTCEEDWARPYSRLSFW